MNPLRIALRGRPSLGNEYDTAAIVDAQPASLVVLRSLWRWHSVRDAVHDGEISDDTEDDDEDAEDDAADHLLASSLGHCEMTLRSVTG